MASYLSNKNKNMNNTGIRRFVFMACIAFFMNNNCVKAQCTYRVMNASNDTTSFYVPCDFPIKDNTGNIPIDDSIYNEVLIKWQQNSPVISELELLTLKSPGITKLFFEIPLSAFDLFTQVRRDKIRENPPLYKVTN